MLAELFGYRFSDRSDLYYSKVKELTAGAIVMDSRGVYDAMTRSVSTLHGLRSTRAGYELTLPVQTEMRWVTGNAQIAGSLTKRNDGKVLLQVLSSGQRWRLVHDRKFVSGRRMKKPEMLRQIREQEALFVEEVAKMAEARRWPWLNQEEPRNKGDERISLPLQHESHDMSVGTS